MSGGRYSLYPESKDSGGGWLGRIPAHWHANKLKFVANSFASNVDKKSKAGETPVKLCNYTDVYYNDVVRADMPFMAATATREQIAKFSLRAGDTIITKDSEDPTDIAVPAFVDKDMPEVICGYHLSMIRPTPGMSPRFLNRAFQCGFARAYFATRSNGLTRYGLGGQALNSVVFPVPPLPEQTQIAAFLDYETAKIDALIQKQQQLIALLKEKRQAVISHAVTKGLNPDAPMRDSGVEWLGEVPAHWEVSRLGYVTSIGNGSTPSRSVQEYWTRDIDGGLGWLNSTRINDGEIRLAEQFISHRALHECHLPICGPDSVLVAITGEGQTRGRAALLRTTATINQHLAYVRPDRSRVAANFLWRQLQARYSWLRFESAGGGSTRAALTCEFLRSVPLTLPPLVEQQELVAAMEEEVGRLETIANKAQLCLALLQERRTALISTAVTGKIDVRNWIPPESPMEAPAA